MENNNIIAIYNEKLIRYHFHFKIILFKVTFQERKEFRYINMTNNDQ